jgi:hypothetical protein
MDDIANGRNGPGAVGGGFHNLERATHAPAVTEFPGNHHALRAFYLEGMSSNLRWGGGIYGQV